MFQDIGMPPDFVNKMARMFQDMKISEDLCQDFRDQHQNDKEGIAGKCHT